MQSTDTTLDEFEHEPIIRPTLLTVLCILTFIGSGWLILSSIWGYTQAPKTARMFATTAAFREHNSAFQNDSVITQTQSKKKSPFGEKMMFSLSKIMTEDNLRKSALGSIVSGIFTLVGALLMWWQKRNGFYLYIAGILVGIVVPFYLYGNNLLAIGISAFSSFFGLIFIALYALNIKSMNK
jgi:hypothetical protein